MDNKSCWTSTEPLAESWATFCSRSGCIFWAKVTVAQAEMAKVAINFVARIILNLPYGEFVKIAIKC
ncbi:hypothetical protein [Polaromonas sp. CG_9.5]|uniref:hypothetical protein n=1 Tax=Polaromonas sp. CG_9.5 TaxID=3071705 RepID=UPI002E0F05AD